MLKFLGRIDLAIFIPAVLLSSFGLLMIYSVSFETDPTLFFRQVLYLLASVIIFFSVARLDFKSLVQLSPVLYALLIVSLIATFIFGSSIRGSTSWIDFGWIRFQASELAKPILILTMAYFFTKYEPGKLRSLVFSAILVAVPVFLVFKQPDFGNSFILASVWLFSVFIAGVNVLFLGATLLLSFAGVPFLWRLLKDYQRERIASFLNPAADPQGSGYNIVQSLIAFGSGQLSGRGFGRGTQSHLDFLPAERTDFIFAATGEELGFFGILAVTVLFAFLIFKVIRIGTNNKNLEGSLFAFGVAFVLFSQFFINAGMNMGMLPVTGVTLPFVSYGGSSLLSMFLALAIVQSAQNSRLN